MSTLADQITQGDRRALAQVITLVESTRSDHRSDADALLTELMPRTGGAMRVGISGAPGSGKSTFIEALGEYLVEHGHSLAVLAVDPSSTQSGGSILGDKTRMAELTRHLEVFVRPSPTGGTLGGVARRTREAMLLCEAAGFDVVLVETVGVGQSEVTVEQMVDCFLLLLTPAAGDELQGIKRGIMELADVVVVNKADGELASLAQITAAAFANALHLVRPKNPGWSPVVVPCSAVERRGIAECWHAVAAHHDVLGADAALERRRAGQAKAWMWAELSTFFDRLCGDTAAMGVAASLEADVMAGRIPAPIAAQQVLEAFEHR